jgi:putative chitinase
VLISKEQFKALMPHASEKNIDKYYPFVEDIFQEYRIITSARIAAFLAQLEVESGSLHYVEEIATGSAYEMREDLGNLEPIALKAAHANHSTTGVWFKGHGLIQITGYYNHLSCGKALGLDLVTNPKLLCEPEYALKSAAWFWDTHNCNALADTNSYGAITKKINGGYNAASERLANCLRNKQTLQCH